MEESASAGKRHNLGLATLICLLGVALIFSLSACSPWTVKPLNDEGGSQGEAQNAVPGKPGFNAKAYVDSIWQSQVLPTVQTTATDLQTVLTALKADPEAAKQKYGHREGQSPYNFLIKGEAKIISIDTTSRTGTLKIADDPQPVAIQIGPVIRGTSLRDALPFIQFNMFTNQLEYADVSNQLNERVLKDVVGNLNTAGLQGKTVEFQGAFTLGSSDTLLITPVKLGVK